MKSSLKRELSEKVRVFCAHCTLHGAYYLPKGQSASVAWGAIMVAGLVLWGVLSHIIWHKYSTDPTVTVVESTYYQSDQVAFPSVMICDPNPVYGPKTKHVSQMLSSQGYNATEIDEFFDSFLYFDDTSKETPMYIKKMHALLQDLGYTLETLLEMLKKPCNVTMVKCRWRSKRYDCSDMFYETVTIAGHCCYFDMAYFGKNVPVSTTLTSGFTTSEALELTVDGAKSFSNGTTRDGDVLLYIFDSEIGLTRMDNAISLLHSCYYDVDLEVYVIDSSREVKALPLRSRKCSISSDPGIGSWSYQKCSATLLMRKVVNYCKCLPFTYTAENLSVDDFPKCKWEQLLCIRTQLNENLADMQSINTMNECYQKCDYAEYDPAVEFIRKTRNFDGSNDTYTKVTMAYAASICLKYRREVIYTWDQMLANLGGIFSLVLGGSIISIVEIVWFLIDLLITTLHSFKENKRTKIFVIERNISKKNIKRGDTKIKYMN